MQKQILRRMKPLLFRSFLALAGAWAMLPGVIPGSCLSINAYGQSPSDTERMWSFTYFGPSTGETQNRLLSSGTGIENDVSITSATFKADGTINKKGGKFVADSPADGASYYYTVIDPTRENFVLQADVTVDQMNPTPDGQEGFALMARDALWTDHSTGSCMSNLMSVTGTRLPDGGVNKGVEVKDTTGFRGYTGIFTPEASDENSIRAIRYGWWKNAEGNTVKVAAGDCYRVRLEKTSTAYIGTQYAIGENGETGDVIGTYTWYIPARDHNAAEVSSYEELDDPLNVQEEGKAYIALVAARGMNVTFRNISFVTSEWDASEWKPQPEVGIDPVLLITSPVTSGNETYELAFKTNADGTAEISRGGQIVDSDVRVSANTLLTKQYDLTGEETVFSVTFTPDPDYRISIFEKLSDYSPQTTSVTVTRREIGSPEQGNIYVKADGLPSNSGTSMDDAVDLPTALCYARPGQTILLRSETYTFTDGPLKIEKGTNGLEDAPITLTTEDGGFAVFDFARKGGGFQCGGNYWHISRINITNSANGSSGMLLSGSYNVLTQMNFYNNGNSGLQISGSSSDEKRLWPSYNSVINCTSMNNADKALEDADGFACKLTAGAGNVFEGCIAAYNADDGWDLFAKIVTGSIGQVVIQNCVTYKNGYLKIKEGGTKKSYVLADIQPDSRGNLIFEDSIEMEAGNGNGFKLGGSNMPGDHCLTDSVSYENKAKGIDSNSGPDISVSGCVSYNNGGPNVALYTDNHNAVTAYAADRVISYRKGEHTDVSDNLRLQAQEEGEIRKSSNYFWDAEALCSVNSFGHTVRDNWFYSLDTTVPPEREEDGAINMHDLLRLRETDLQVTPPAAKALTYSGTAQELVTAPDAQEDMTVFYALGTDAVTPPAEKTYSTSVPSGTASGIYYVWYKLIGTAGTPDTEPACIAVRIKSETTFVPRKAPTEYSPGNKAHYAGNDGKLYWDALGLAEISDRSEVVIPALGNTTQGNDSSSGSSGSSGGSTGKRGIILISADGTRREGSTGTTAAYNGRWDKDALGSWHYSFENGREAGNEWVLIDYAGRLSWYAFDENGRMRTGWFADGSELYYLETATGGSQGMMATGWKEIDGKWYYFEPAAGNTQGRMYRNERTPDGYTVAADGSRIEDGVRGTGG